MRVPFGYLYRPPATWAREHEDLKSIEHYIATVRNEELALREHAAETAASGN